MKKVISIMSMLAAAASLTACSDINSPAENISGDPTSSQSSTSLQSTTSTQSTTSSQSTTFSEESTISSTFPENVTAPDGSTVNFSEAIRVDQKPQDTYIFDYAFVRLAEGSLYTTNEDPTLYDWITKKFAKDLPANEPKYVKVKAGDTLANGLTIIGAQCEFANNPTADDKIFHGFTGNILNFGNQNTELTGYLRCVPYMENKYEFYADPSQSDPIPISFCRTNKRFGIKIADEEEQFAAMGDDAVIELKIPENTEIDLTKIDPNKFIKAKVKVNKINVYYYVSLEEYINATLVDLEIL